MIYLFILHNILLSVQHSPRLLVLIHLDIQTLGRPDRPTGEAVCQNGRNVPTRPRRFDFGKVLSLLIVRNGQRNFQNSISYLLELQNTLISTSKIATWTSSAVAVSLSQFGLGYLFLAIHSRWRSMSSAIGDISACKLQILYPVGTDSVPPEARHRPLNATLNTREFNQQDLVNQCINGAQNPFSLRTNANVVDLFE